MSRNQILLIVIGGALVLFGIPLTLYLISQQQDPRSRASEVVYPDEVGFSTQPQPTTTQTGGSVQQSCEAPVSPENTDISYPYDDGVNIDLNKASCSWDPVADASSYNVTITELDTETVVDSGSRPAGTTVVVFDVNQGSTYLCEVSAVNSCGAVSAASSDQQLCETEAFISPSPSPSPSPTTPVATQPPEQPTSTPTPTTAPPQATPPPTGTAETLLVGGGLAAFIVAVGAAFLLW